jgi:hypothetical protein
MILYANIRSSKHPWRDASPGGPFFFIFLLVVLDENKSKCKWVQIKKVAGNLRLRRRRWFRF